MYRMCSLQNVFSTECVLYSICYWPYAMCHADGKCAPINRIHLSASTWYMPCAMLTINCVDFTNVGTSAILTVNVRTLIVSMAHSTYKVHAGRCIHIPSMQIGIYPYGQVRWALDYSEGPGESRAPEGGCISFSPKVRSKL